MWYLISHTNTVSGSRLWMFCKLAASVRFCLHPSGLFHSFLCETWLQYTGSPAHSTRTWGNLIMRKCLARTNKGCWCGQFDFTHGKRIEGFAKETIYSRHCGFDSADREVYVREGIESKALPTLQTAYIVLHQNCHTLGIRFLNSQRVISDWIDFITSANRSKQGVVGKLRLREKMASTLT